MNEKEFESLKEGMYLHCPKKKLEWLISKIGDVLFWLECTDVSESLDWLYQIGEQGSYEKRHIIEQFEVGQLPKNESQKIKEAVLISVIDSFNDESRLQQRRLADIGRYIATNGYKLLVIADIGRVRNYYSWSEPDYETNRNVVPVVNGLLNEAEKIGDEFNFKGIDVESIIEGSKHKKVIKKEKQPCSECSGTGEVEWEYGVHTMDADCPVCEGSGEIMVSTLTDELELGNCFIKFDFGPRVEYMQAKDFGIMATMHKYFDAEILLELIRYNDNTYFRMTFAKKDNADDNAVLLFMAAKIFQEGMKVSYSVTNSSSEIKIVPEN